MPSFSTTPLAQSSFTSPVPDFSLLSPVPLTGTDNTWRSQTNQDVPHSGGIPQVSINTHTTDTGITVPKHVEKPVSPVPSSSTPTP